jgi:hypothetical protein
MIHDSKNTFINFVRQFSHHHDGTYNGYRMDERGNFFLQLSELSSAFRQEYTKNLLERNALLYSESLQLELQGILMAVSVEFDERILEYKRPITQEELGEGYDVTEANRHQRQQYIDNGLREVEEMVRRQIDVIQESQNFIEGHIQILKRQLEEKVIVYSDEPISKITHFENLPVTDPTTTLNFRLSKSAIVLFFHLLHKSEHIANGANEVMALLERHFAFEDKGTFKRITGSRILLSQLITNAKPYGPSQEKTFEILNEVKKELDVLIELVKTNKIDP